ncbi:MAG: DUF262 domain-containing protein [Methylocystaceae bacterium]|nr:DUF262 domain-containing protein [Methylocystaceae bacterium]
MKKVGDLFKAQASSPLETAMLYNGSVGFVVPEYQRQYDWAEENIRRLFFDSLNGFHRLSESGDANAFTFLGTLILVEEQNQESDFSGVSVAVIDGQQRLTTLMLFACALIAEIRHQKSLIDPAELNDWLNEEINTRLYDLYECSIGAQRVSSTQSFPFPRMVRKCDVRGKSTANSEYTSPLGKFLEGFAGYFDSDKTIYTPPALGMGTDAEKLALNYDIIQNLVSQLNNSTWYSDDSECEQFEIDWLRRGQCRTLLGRLTDFMKGDAEASRAIEELISNEKLHPLVRTLLYSAYFCKCIVLTRVITEDESAAFDIFDALNTTGEPLTALETLKPRVINFENKDGTYAGSQSEEAFQLIEKYIDKRFSETSKKQNETKDLIVTFALYLEGKKLPKDLAAQRNFLRTSYDGATRNGTNSARKFVDAVAQSALFRRYYWEPNGIEELSRYHQASSLDEVQLLMSLIRDMKTSLALPILFRYWNPDLKENGENDFVQVLKSLTAFLVLRRAATGGTAGIDSDFRAIMAPKTGRGATRKYGLYAGVDHSNPLLSPNDLKAAFRTLLEHKIKSLSKETWVSQAIANPLYEQSRELVRFMVLTAAHQAMPDPINEGLWSKEGVRHDTNVNNFLNYKTWCEKTYATVEHIAPDTMPERGWNTDELYSDNILRHSLGNLALLPSKENSAIGNDSWEKKKKFYSAFSAATVEEQQRRVEEAKAAGIVFKKSTLKLMQEGTRLTLLQPLENVEEWNKNIVVSRGRNIAELCWDHVWPWLN